MPSLHSEMLSVPPPKIFWLLLGIGIILASEIAVILSLSFMRMIGLSDLIFPSLLLPGGRPSGCPAGWFPHLAGCCRKTQACNVRSRYLYWRSDWFCCSLSHVVVHWWARATGIVRAIFSVQSGLCGDGYYASNWWSCRRSAHLSPAHLDLLLAAE